METEIDIKALRDALKETQAEFAQRFGVDQGTVSNWEKRKTKPSGPARMLMSTLAREVASGPQPAEATP